MFWRTRRTSHLLRIMVHHGSIRTKVHADAIQAIRAAFSAHKHVTKNITGGNKSVRRFVYAATYRSSRKQEPSKLGDRVRSLVVQDRWPHVRFAKRFHHTEKASVD
mmetsp:Transcript_18549/g.57550  ORF Transcript_18549/g.57550 Transcript_18549/m.57550 type:complete len:106 (-) Transcript_18549:5-322(-)